MSSSLSAHERSVIETMNKFNHSTREIARFLKRSPATITYELNRIKPYNAQQAHHLAQCNQHKYGRHPDLTPEISTFLNHHIGILQWSPLTAAHVLGIAFKTIYNWIHHGLLKIKASDLPDNKRQSDGRRRVFAHGRSIEKRPKAVSLRQEFGHFEVDTMQSGKVRGDVLVTITERLSRQHIVRHVVGSIVRQ